MAGHIQDRWYKTETGPDGNEQSQSFPDREKGRAETWLNRIKADTDSGQFFDPKAGRITFREYAEKWLGGLTTDVVSQEAVKRRVRLHAVPHLGSRPMGSFKPEHVRTWLSELKESLPNATYRRAIYDSVSALFNAAKDDGVIRANPCHAQSVKAPEPDPRLVQPWSEKRVLAVRAGLLDRFAAMVDVGGGCGLRQGEIFDLDQENIDAESGWLNVRQQVKRVGGKLVFAPPKRGKLRDVPLSPVTAGALSARMKRFPPVEVKLALEEPGRAAGGPSAGLHERRGEGPVAQLLR